MKPRHFRRWPRWAPLLALAVMVLAGPARAADKAKPAPASEMITPAADRAIDKGLKWLAAHQYDDGSFASGAYRGNVGISGLAGLAMLSSGSTPGRGPYGAKIDKTIDYLLASTQESGYINAPAGAGHPRRSLLSSS